jgi:hypothetical protein
MRSCRHHSRYLLGYWTNGIPDTRQFVVWCSSCIWRSLPSCWCPKGIKGGHWAYKLPKFLFPPHHNFAFYCPRRKNTSPSNLHHLDIIISPNSGYMVSLLTRFSHLFTLRLTHDVRRSEANQEWYEIHIESIGKGDGDEKYGVAKKRWRQSLHVPFYAYSPRYFIMSWRSNLNWTRSQFFIAVSWENRSHSVASH